MLVKILGNAQEDSMECSKRFRGIFEKISGNVQEDSGECSKRFREMLKKIPGNLNLDLLCEIWLISYQTLQLNCDKTKKYFLHYYLLLITNLLRLNTVFSTYIFVVVFLLSERGCNYCAQVQRYQKTLNNSQLWGLKNTLHWVRTINLKLENWINAFVAYRYRPQNQLQELSARLLYIQLWKLQNTEYKTLYTILGLI